MRRDFVQYTQQNLEFLCKTNKHEKSGKKSKKALAIHCIG